MNGRVYDYNLGRFMSVDPFVHKGSQGINPYSYVFNNPLSGTDPTGYEPCKTGSHIKSGGDAGNCAATYDDNSTGKAEHEKRQSAVIGQIAYNGNIGGSGYSDTMDIEGELEKATKNSSTNVGLGQQGLSLGLDVAPVVGGVKGVAQVFTGEDLITGEKLSRWEEAGYAVLGFFGAKGLAKAGDIADFGEASLKVLRQSDSLGGFAKGISIDEITAINKQFSSGATLTGDVSTVLANAANRDGFYNKSASIIRDIAGGHLFENGNKRTAQAVVESLMQRNAIRSGPSSAQLRSIVNQVGKGNLKNVDDISTALRGY